MSNPRDVPDEFARDPRAEEAGVYPTADHPIVAAATPNDVENDVEGGRAVASLRFADVPRLELDQLLEQLRDRATDVLAAQGRLRGLLRANAWVGSELSLPIVLRRIVESSRELLGAHYAALGVIGPDGRLEQFVHSGMDDDTVAEIGMLPHGRGILGLLIKHPAPIRLSKLSDHPASSGFPPGHPPMNTFLGVPIQVGSEVYGNLYLTERTDGSAFTADDENLAVVLAAAAGVAISNARLFAESEQRRRWLAASGELTHRLLSTDSDPLGLITQEAATAADADFATLALPHGESELVVTSVYGVLADELRGVTASVDDSLAGQAIKTGKPLLANHAEDVVLVPALSIDVDSLLVVPLTSGEQVRGALSLGRLAGRPSFSEADMSMAATFGNHAAVALELMDARSDQMQLAQMEDHDRIARDLHDHVIQEVFAVGIGLQTVAGAVDRPDIGDRLMGYVDALDRVITQIRATIFKLSLGPEYGNLESRLLGIAAQHTPQLGFAPQMDVSGLDDVVPEPMVDDILAVTRESLSNCARHAGATAVEVHLDVRDGAVTLVVVDNGRGLGSPERSSGLTHMRQRAERHGGTFEVSTPEGGGTRLLWTAPADA